MSDDRSWAVGLNQERFNVEYERKFPSADVIPDVDLWLSSGEPVYHGISPINDADFITEVVGEKAVSSDEPQKLEAKIKQPGMFKCRGCGLPHDYHIQRWTHEKKCQKVLAGDIRKIINDAV